MLVKGLFVQQSRGDSFCTMVNEIEVIGLMLQELPQVIDFKADAVLQYVELGLYSKR